MGRKKRRLSVAEKYEVFLAVISVRRPGSRSPTGTRRWLPRRLTARGSSPQWGGSGAGGCARRDWATSGRCDRASSSPAPARGKSALGLSAGASPADIGAGGDPGVLRPAGRPRPTPPQADPPRVPPRQVASLGDHRAARPARRAPRAGWQPAPRANLQARLA